jgi:hypothetical protein
MLLAACTKEISVSSYTTSCASDDECVVVGEGHCDDCGNPRIAAAINAVDLKRYDKDYRALDCHGHSECDTANVFYVAYCDSGVCAAAACTDLSISACASHTECFLLRGDRFDDTTACLAESANVACENPWCGERVQMARDPQGRCWSLEGECIPDGWTYGDDCPEQFATDGC